MNTRQATKQLMTLFALLAFITACSPAAQPVPSPSPDPTKPVPIIWTSTPPPATGTPTPTQITCLTRSGRVDKGTLETTDPPQGYLIYLPPCYDQQASTRYPALYLLHGQTYTADQWLRLGVARTLNRLIRSGKSQPFIIVFPDDRYWNLVAGSGFGDRLVNFLIPYIDEKYRTIPDRDHRALGGLSRGSGWALRLGLSHWDLFSIIGLHSLAVFQEDGSRVEQWLEDIPTDSYPIVYMDIGDNDQELARAQLVESEFNDHQVPHEWHLNTGAHTEEYWSMHVEEYIEWYASQWNNP